MKYLIFPLIAFTALSAERLTTVNTNIIPMLKRSSKEEVRAWLEVNQISSYTGTAYMTVDTISALTNIVVTNGQPTVVQTKGFYAAGDRGGATYIWRSTSTTTTNIYRINANGGGQWWEQDYLQRVFCNVVKAGANPMSTTFNNAPAFQLAFDAALQQSTGGGTDNMGDEPVIYIPTGYYRFNAPVYYIAPNRGQANIRIEGAGQKNTILASYMTNGALLNLKNIKFSMAKLQIYSPYTASEYGRDGIYTFDCEYGNVYDVGFTRMARAIILQNGSMNWNIFSGLQFEGCLIDFLSINSQGTTVLGAHTTGGKFIWYGNVLGVRWVGSAEGKPGNTFAPASILIPAGSNSDFDVAYTEANKWVAILGHSVTNRATASINGTNIQLTFQEQHPFYAGNSADIIAEQPVPQDIQDYLVGTRVLHTTSMTNNYALLTPGGTITNNLSGYTFLVIKNVTNTAGVLNTRIRSSFAGNFFNPDPIAQYFAAVNNVNDLVLEGEGAETTMITTNTGNIIINGKYPIRGDSKYPIGQADRIKMLMPENIFPDPTFKTGLSWTNGPAGLYAGGTVVPTNYFGQPALLFYQAAQNLYYDPQAHYNFQPIRPMSSLIGKRLAIAAEMIELNHPIFVPTNWTINSAGSGYTNGLATIAHLGRTIQVNLDTDNGAITNVSWYFGAFATNVVTNAVAVVQGTATGGEVTPTAFDNRSYYNKRYLGRSLSVTLRKSGENLNQPAMAGVWGAEMLLDPITGHYKLFRVSGLSAPLTDTTALRISFAASGHKPAVGGTPGNATGCEAYLVTRLYVFVEPFYNHNLDSTVFLNRVHQQGDTVTKYVNASRFGPSWPGAAVTNISSLFAGQEGGVTTLRVQRDNGTVATIPGFRGVTTNTPVNSIPGDTFISNNIYYIYTGSAWLPVN